MDYKTFPDSNGFSLVVGQNSNIGALVELFQYVISLPPVSGNQEYINGPIELAPGMFFNHVLVPTSEEMQGNFRDFGGPIYDPFFPSPSSSTDQFATDYNLPPGLYHQFPLNIIPASLLYGVFAFRVGPDDAGAAVPEPAGIFLFALGIAVLMISMAVRKISQQSSTWRAGRLPARCRSRQ